MIMMKTIGQKQKSDILIIPAQLGMMYRGSSMRRAQEIFSKKEFGFGAFEVGITILTHSDRFVCQEDLGVGCPGDKYIPGPFCFFFRCANLQIFQRWAWVWVTPRLRCILFLRFDLGFSSVVISFTSMSLYGGSPVGREDSFLFCPFYLI